MKVFTAGYAGHSPGRLLEIADRENALVMDIRYRPVSKAAMWCADALLKSFGGRYVQNTYWGNTRYNQGPPITIRNLDMGLRRFWAIVERRRPDVVILLCVCRAPCECHRSVIARFLREQGLQVQELEWSERETRKKEVQPGLFEEGVS